MVFNRGSNIEENIISIIGGIFSIFGGIHIIYQAIIYTINIFGFMDSLKIAFRVGYIILSLYILILGVTIIFTGFLMIKYGFSKEVASDWYEYHYSKPPDKK